MLQPHQKLEGQDHADQLPMHRPHDDFEDLLDDVLNTLQLSPAADPVPTCTVPYSNF